MRKENFSSHFPAINVDLKLVCGCCKRQFVLHTNTSDKYNPFLFESTVSKYRSAGIDAEQICFCTECAKVNGVPRQIFRIKGKDGIYHQSVPREVTYYYYDIYLKLLSAKDFSETYNNLKLNDESFFADSDFVHCRIDKACEMIAGAVTVYSYKEAAKSLEALFCGEKLEKALALLDERYTDGVTANQLFCVASEIE